MPDVMPVEDDTRGAVLVAYVLYLLAPFNGATALVGVIIAYVKRAEARGTVWESHFRNLIRVFWISAVIFILLAALVAEAFGGLFFNLVATNGNPPPAMVGLFFLLVPLLWVAGLLWLVWYLFRVVRGFARALEARPL